MQQGCFDYNLEAALYSREKGDYMNILDRIYLQCYDGTPEFLVDDKILDDQMAELLKDREEVPGEMMDLLSACSTNGLETGFKRGISYGVQLIIEALLM